MLENYGLTVEDVVFFEHNPEAVKSAETAGIKTMYYDPERRDLIELKRFIQENI